MEDFDEKIKNLDPRLQKQLKTFEEVFGDLPFSGSCKKLVEMDLKLKPESGKQKTQVKSIPSVSRSCRRDRATSARMH